MPAPTPASAAAIWVSNNGAGTTPHARLNAIRSSLALCMILSTAGSVSSGARAAHMPGTSGSINRMSEPIANCTSASWGQ